MFSLQDTLYTASLQVAPLLADEDVPHTFMDPFISPLLSVLRQILYMPYEWRKLILDFTRVQSPFTSNNCLRDRLSEIRVTQVPYLSVAGQKKYLAYIKKQKLRIPKFQETIDLVFSFCDREINIYQVAEELSNYWDNFLVLSVISYFVRAERTLYVAEFLKVNEELIIKEVAASQQSSKPQCVDWSILFSGYYLTKPLHDGGAIPRKVLERISSFVLRQGHRNRRRELIIPFYSTKKNIGRYSQCLYYTERGIDMEEADFQVTTRDLLVHYYQTGSKIQGPIEMRSAWRVNDLKGRVYYCLGGQPYWEGLYIKPIVKELQQVLPCVDPFTRFDVARIGKITDDEILVTYDYSSFTTSLSELKYFLFYFSTLFEGIEIQVLDVRDGIQTLDMGRLLLRYNEAMNLHQEFDIVRLVNRSFTGSTILNQGRSGSLGVQGNIGFSTICHGVNISSFTDTPEEDSCVGDDALVKQLAILFPYLSIAINKLGAINPEKISTLHKPSMENYHLVYQQQFKYLKRPLNVDFEGRVLLGTLADFPNLVECLFPEGDGIHTTVEKDIGVLLQSFTSQWGRFLTRCYAMPQARDMLLVSEFIVILGAVQRVYNTYSLPIEGHFRYVYKDAGRGVPLLVPPVDSIDIFGADWLEILYSSYSGYKISCLYEVGGSIPPPLDTYVGETFQATSTPFLDLLCDLHLFTREVPSYESHVTELIYQSIRRLVLYNESLPYLISYTPVIIPHYYIDVHNAIYRVSDPDVVTGTAATLFTYVSGRQSGDSSSN